MKFGGEGEHKYSHSCLEAGILLQSGKGLQAFSRNAATPPSVLCLKSVKQYRLVIQYNALWMRSQNTHEPQEQWVKVPLRVYTNS